MDVTSVAPQCHNLNRCPLALALDMVSREYVFVEAFKSKTLVFTLQMMCIFTHTTMSDRFLTLLALASLPDAQLSLSNDTAQK